MIQIHSTSGSRVLLISLDGFHYEYLSKGLTPTLEKLGKIYSINTLRIFIAKNGAKGRLIPQFPSYTFPNHFTLVTGQYPASHGIVSNRFYDTQLNDTFFHTGKTATRINLMELTANTE